MPAPASYTLMILLLAFALAVGWALARGGRLSRLQSLPLSAAGVALGACALQIVVMFMPVGDASGALLRPALFMLSYGFLAFFVWRNRSLPGMPLIAVGLLLNWGVMLANGGYMPVTFESLRAAGRAGLVAGPTTGSLVAGSKDILLTAAETRLWLLSDILIIPPPFPLSSVFSVGDVLIAAGLFWLVQAALRAETGIRSHMPGATGIGSQLPEQMGNCERVA